MDQVITQDAFISAGGRLVAKHAARIVEHNVSILIFQLSNSSLSGEKDRSPLTFQHIPPNSRVSL